MSKDILTITLSSESQESRRIQANFDKDAHQNRLTMSWNIKWITGMNQMNQSNNIYQLLCYDIDQSLRKTHHVDTIFIAQSISNLFTFDQISEIWRSVMNQVWQKYSNINSLDLYIEIKDLDALKKEILNNQNLQNDIEEYDMKFINLNWNKRSIIIDNWKIIDSSDYR